MPLFVNFDSEKQILNLKCDFSDKDLAKRAGGRWNQSLKTWDFAYDSKVIKKMISAFPALSSSLSTLYEEKEKNEKIFLEYRKEANENLTIDYELSDAKLQPYNYQKHGIRCGLSIDGGFLIADEMGLGKSSQAIFISLERKKQGCKNCLIVCPASVKYNWLNEIDKFTNEKALVIEGNQSDRVYKWFVEWYFFKIVNYDILVRDLFYDNKEINSFREGEEIPDKYLTDKYTIRKIGNTNIIYYADNRIYGWEKILQEFDIIVVDEIHYIKTHSSFRTKILKQFNSKYKIGLTGTPLDGKLEELHSIFEFIKPHLFESKSKFMEKHAVYGYFNEIKGYIKIDEVKEKIMPYYIRRLKKDVLKDLPDKIFKDIYVELSSDALDEYKELAKRKHEITEDKEAIVAVVRCRQYCDFPSIIDIPKSSAKFNALLELLDEIIDENKQKAIIFSQYKQVTDLLCKKLNTKYNILVLDGDTPNNKRFDICEKFNNDDKINLIIMTDAGSVGINLTSASYVINYDDNYSPSVMLQRADRAHRIGQKNVVTVVRFICRDTIEERVRQVIDNKLIVNAQVLDEEYSEMFVGKLTTTELLGLL